MAFSWMIITGLSLLSQFCKATIDSNSYVYPNSTIPCKLYYRTSLDCKHRKLISIPPLPHGGLLERLDLSHNKLPYLPDNAFHGLHKLKLLDLSYNALENISGSPFRDLTLLQELSLAKTGITSIDDVTFIGLKSLELLNMTCLGYLSDVIGTPLSELQSLHVLSLRVLSDCINANSLFAGLDQLTDLKLDVCCKVPDWLDSLCMLDSLHSLDIWTYQSFPFEKCFQRIPVKNLIYDSSINPYASSFEHLKNLTSFHCHFMDVIEPLLSTIDSPLEELTLVVEVVDSTSFALNSTTFARWATWSASLRDLCIIVHDDLQIEGSPFSWFPNLRKLTIIGNVLNHTLPLNTFMGLDTVEELYMDVKIDVFTTKALDVFKHLRHLQLTNNLIDYTLPHQFCSMLSSLTYLDLSYNDLNYDPPYRPCPSLPNLKIIKMVDCPSLYSFIDVLCDMAPQLYEMDLSGPTGYPVITNSCPNLVILNLSQSSFGFRTYNVFLPHLITLYLKQVEIALPMMFYQPLTSLKQIRIHAPNLKDLDLSSNQIAEIDEMDAVFLSNLTYLNLADNKLTSVKNLQYLKHLQTLRLNGNKITVVPGVSLLKSYHPYLDFLALQDNVYVCNCSVEPFRRWILRDDAVYLETDGGAPPTTAYQCLTPDSMKGLSITEINLDCRSPLWIYLSISIPCAFILILVAIVGVRYHWHIQYGLFLLFNRRKRYHNYIDNDDDDDIDQDDENGIPRFDAYVAYHEDDEDWVDRELLPNIEEGQEHFRLCLRGRDVPAGRLLINAVSVCIQRSRKSLVILSPRFVENNWCYFQLSMAHQRFLEEGRNVLIFIVLEDIPNDKMTLILRQLFCKIRCLKWPNDGIGQRLFWQRLRKELKRPVLVDRHYQIN